MQQRTVPSVVPPVPGAQTCVKSGSALMTISQLSTGCLGSSSILDTEMHEGPREARPEKREEASACVGGPRLLLPPAQTLGTPWWRAPGTGELTAPPTWLVVTYRLSRGAGSSSDSETPSSSSSLKTSPAGDHSTDVLHLSLKSNRDH